MSENNLWSDNNSTDFISSELAAAKAELELVKVEAQVIKSDAEATKAEAEALMAEAEALMAEVLLLCQFGKIMQKYRLFVSGFTVSLPLIYISLGHSLSSPLLPA